MWFPFQSAGWSQGEPRGESGLPPPPRTVEATREHKRGTRTSLTKEVSVEVYGKPEISPLPSSKQHPALSLGCHWCPNEEPGPLSHATVLSEAPTKTKGLNKT